MWKTVSQYLWRWRGILVAVPVITVTILGLRAIGVLQASELAVLDLFFQLRPPEPIDERVVIVEINEADIQAIGYPIPDGKLAQVLNTLKQQNPHAIGLDLYRDLPIGSGREELVKVFQSTSNLIGIRTVGGESGPSVNAPPELDPAQISSNDLVPDTDGKIRRNLLSLADRRGEVLMTLGFHTARLYLEAEGIDLEVVDADQQQYRLGKTVFKPIDQNDGGYVRAAVGGFQLLSNFRNLKSGLRTISFTDALNQQIPAGFAQGRVVFIGYTAISTADFFLTPYSSGWFDSSFSRTSGVTLHADLASQLISAALDGRPFIRVWSDSLEGLWIFGWSLVGATIAWRGRVRQRQKMGKYNQTRRQWFKLRHESIFLPGLSIVGLATGLTVGSYMLFLHGLWIPVVPGVLALFSAAVVVIGYVAYHVTAIRQTLSRYLTDQVATSLLETPEGLNIGGERRTVTILMSDLRGFSAISERLTPEAAMMLLNRYLEVMVDVITDYGGTINEILGDGIFVIFGAPMLAPDDAERAVACAIAMQLALATLNEQNHTLNLLPIEMGIGVHTGEVLAGNIGSQKRAKYAVVGRNVNLTARIESCTVGGQVFVSQETVDQVGMDLIISAPMQVELKGFQEPIMIHDVIGIRGQFNLMLPQPEDMLIPLRKSLPLVYSILEDKQLAAEQWPGRLVQLSRHRAELHADRPLELRKNLKIRLLVNDEPFAAWGDLYAKVVQVSDSYPHQAMLHFTHIPPELHRYFQRLYQSIAEE